MPTPSRRTDTTPVIIGVTGTVGAGKSLLVAALRKYGALVFSADDEVHRLYRDPAVVAAVRDRVGGEVFDGAGHVDRTLLGRMAFSDPGLLAWLEQLLHPLVGDAWDRFVERSRWKDPRPRALVAEVPLLFESAVADRYDLIVTVDAPAKLRAQRCRARGDDGPTLSAREARQLPGSDKQARADRVLINDGSVEDVDRWAADLLDELAPVQPVTDAP